MKLAERINAAWYRPHLTPCTVPLLPLAWAYAGITAFRRLLYRSGALQATKLPVPVIVVGNIAVGGTGKTPLVIALAGALNARGWRPGVVSRGHRGSLTRSAAGTLVVTRYADPRLVGDEPLVMARAGIAVAVGRDRAAAARSLCTAHPDIDVIIADDGLQHYALLRDVEIAVFDAQRGLGNGQLLPAGPLREGVARLRTVNAVVITHGVRDGIAAVSSGTFVPVAVRAFVQTLEPGLFRRVNAPDVLAAATRFVGRTVHALAGIGHPERFFATLGTLKIDAITHAFPDHHWFTAADLAFPDAEAILMTEKDAVKCASFADARCWYLPVRARVDSALITLVENTIRGFQAA
ncbi:MAG: tetraacyldisaccharide 4'-kinase [Casimicrobiaceae bacterium]